MNFKNLSTGRNVLLLGHNGALAATNEFVNESSLVFSGAGATNLNITPAAAGVIVAVASTSAQDAAGGTGALTLEIVGAKGTTNEVISEIITLTGTTTVNSVNYYQTIYSAVCKTFGTGLANAGIIGISLKSDATNTAGALTAPTPCLTIPVGDNLATNPIYIIPPNSRYKIKRMFSGVATQPVVVSLYVRPSGEGWCLLKRIPLGNAGGMWMEDDLYEFELNSGDAIRVDALSTTAAGRVHITLVLEKQDYTA